MNNIMGPPEAQVQKNDGKSEIAEFYNGTNILVTGGTGFLGKLLIEKLLRSCPGIATIYMMVRPKKGKTSEDRFKENFNEVIYDRLKQEQPNFLSKIVMVEGDAAEENFGLTPEIKNMLINTNIIFHAAATVRFNEKIRLAVRINVETTKALLLWAKQLPNLKAFVYVSTAFSNCVHKVIKEVHYESTIEPDNLLTLMDCLDDDKLEAINPVLRGKYPNNYTLTKATAENVVLKYGDTFPTCIVRPSMILGTCNEPIKGWLNNLYGPNGALASIFVGLLHTFYCRRENIADCIPADYVISNIIAAAWDVGTKKSLTKSEQESNISPEEKVPIYNSVSSSQNPITWNDCMTLSIKHAVRYPSVKSVWYISFKINRYWFLHQIYVFFVQLVPAVIVDTLARLVGRKPVLLDMYRKIHTFSEMMEYFTIREWKFRNENVMNLWKKLNLIDQKMFNFNVEDLDWNEYTQDVIKGIRVYILNDPMDTKREGLIRYKRLRIAHYSVLTFLLLLLLWSIVSFVFFLWSYYPLSH